MQRTYGFTIVELLIVIVVIAILAALSYVGYTNISQLASNSVTIQAAQAWIKAIRMYEQEHGEVPHIGWDSCLGEGYPWDYAGTGSGMNQCHSSTNSYYIEKQSIKTALAPYMDGQVPTPSMQAIGTEDVWSRGIIYMAPSVGGIVTLSVTQKGVDTCPVISGLSASVGGAVGGVRCSYPLGTRLR